MKLESDNQLIKQAQLGDADAFGLLVNKYRARINQVLRGVVHDQASINDISQESFMRAFQGIPQFNGQCQFYTWLYRIAINTAKNYAKKHHNQTLEIDIDSKMAVYGLAQQSLSNDILDPEDITENNEFEQAISEALETLPEDLRRTLELKEQANLSYDQIAAQLDCPIGTIRSRLYRAREMLVQKAIDILLHHQQGKIGQAIEIRENIKKRRKK